MFGVTCQIQPAGDHSPGNARFMGFLALYDAEQRQPDLTIGIRHQIRCLHWIEASWRSVSLEEAASVAWC
jgi:hypothetical protein